MVSNRFGCTLYTYDELRKMSENDRFKLKSDVNYKYTLFENPDSGIQDMKMGVNHARKVHNHIMKGF